ncbi:hypothetical protein [Thiovibrio frasassiensis]|uniref:Uncharacterized protein n=1 Tax=Thiovibrio frasassiensis TaxID=2984131 RepID=A0A9X4ML03_9BACT|nr:hypothetical protein [Thiovibrio frasassiensis]MDG4476749.1 hypothetical protein [Thiovibrio frasassiensis]
MKVQIESIFPSSESPRYLFGKIGKKSTDEYVVFSPMDTGSDFDLNDIVKFVKVSQGPVEAINQTKNKTALVGIHDICINKDVIRVRYDSQFP